MSLSYKSPDSEVGVTVRVLLVLKVREGNFLIECKFEDLTLVKGHHLANSLTMPA